MEIHHDIFEADVTVPAHPVVLASGNQLRGLDDLTSPVSVNLRHLSAVDPLSDVRRPEVF